MSNITNETLEWQVAYLSEQLEKAAPGTPEASRISNDLLAALDLKEGFDKEAKEVKTSRRETIKFAIQTAVQLIGIGVPAALALAMLKYSNSGSYQTADENKVWWSLFNSAKK